VGASLAAPIDRGKIQVGDGDTIRVEGERIRLLGFDSSEMGSSEIQGEE
jgi:endonuclease YncB( thermonuclease family)